MISANVSMPHPVLGIPGDMEGLFNLRFSIGVNRNSRNYVFDSISVNITNAYIHDLYQSGFLNLVVKVSCIPTYANWVFINPAQFSISENDIDLQLEVESYLMANQKLNGYYHESFDNVFDGKKFDLDKDDIVAVTGALKLPINKEDEKTSIGSIFRFLKINADSDDQALHFTFDQDPITVHYPDGNSEYDPITFLFDTKQGTPYTALSLYIIPALTEAFAILRSDKDKFEDFRWAEVLCALLPEEDWTDDNFINAQKAIKVGIPISLAFEELLKLKCS